jgi:hypothetical protein
MDISFQDVDADRVHATQGPKVRFDFISRGGAAVRSLLSISDTHIGYSTKDGAKFRTTRTLINGNFVHPAEVMVSAAEVGGRRDYDFQIAINGVIVVSAAGSIPDGKTTDMDDQSFQLRVL